MIHATNGTEFTVLQEKRTSDCPQARLPSPRTTHALCTGPINPTPPGSQNVVTFLPLLLSPIPSPSTSPASSPLEGGGAACVDDDNESKKDFCGLYARSFSSSSLPAGRIYPGPLPRTSHLHLRGFLALLGQDGSLMKTRIGTREIKVCRRDFEFISLDYCSMAVICT